MKIERSKEWWLQKASQEGNVTIAAGAPLQQGDPELRVAEVIAFHADASRLAFGKFVNLMRRQRGWAVEDLASRADVDTGEVLAIEEDPHHVPEPRTIFKLSQCFEVPQQKLLQLAGLARARDADLRVEALKFAARSEGMQKLSLEESAALEAFISVLSDSEPDSQV